MNGENDSSVNSLVKESRLLTFSELNEGDLEWTWTSLDQELDSKIKHSFLFRRTTRHISIQIPL